MLKKIPFKPPIADILDGATRGIAVNAIAGYQRFISPHKGFSCAHRVLYGCESCSQYFKRVIAEDGLFTAIANAKGRFQECREANEILKERRAKCQSRRRYYARNSSYTRTNHAIAVSSEDDFEKMLNMADLGDLGDLEQPEDPDRSEDPNDPPQPNQKRIGGSRWASKRRSQANNQIDNQANNNGDGNNNCGNYVDCSDLVDCADCTDGMGVLDCNSLSCPDLSCPDLNCGNADCLSGMDCSGCGDCGNLDCGGADCGSCG